MTKQLNDNKLNIECEWMKGKRLLINPDGQVLPCCYFANIIYMYDKMGGDAQYLLDKDEDSVEKRVERRKKFQNDISRQIGDRERIVNETKNENILMEYYKDKENFNIFNRPLEEIMNDEWFTKTLPESWDDEDKLTRQCKAFCQKKNK